MSATTKPGRARILVVDDEPGNRSLVRDALEAGNYHVIEAGGGREALRIVDRGEADVVVLDVVMPDVDGLEVCRVIRGNPATASLPVILVTAHYGREERLKGIEAGASDFLRKPLDLTDLTLRVRNAVASKRLHDQAVRDYKRVVELESLRDNLVHMIVHDLRSPLTSMRSNLQLVEMDAAGVLPEESLDMIRETIEATTLFTQMVTGILDVSRLEAGELPLCVETSDLASLTQTALSLLGERAASVKLTVSAEGAEAVYDPELIRRVIINILANALDFSPNGAPVEVTISEHSGMVRFACSDHGPGIPKDQQKKIFQKFSQVDSSAHAETKRGPSSGLGLTFCKLAVGAHSGIIGVESVVGLGSTFWFELPVNGPTGHNEHSAEQPALPESVKAAPAPVL